MLKINKRILVSGPNITQKDIDYVAESVKYGWNENAYKYVTEFENKFKDYIGVKYALATSSCTGALHIALLALGIGSGDEVIIPDTSWIATVEPIFYVGAKPVYVDIDPETWCIDPDKIEEKITSKTKAIIPVHLYGHCSEMKKINKIAKKYHLSVIEDAAESLGGEYFGKKTGSIGDIGCFSFHGSKTLTTGEGGILLTNSQKIYNKAKFFYDHCKSSKKPFWNLGIGYKYKMSNMQAALGTSQLSHLDKMVNWKRDIFFLYQKRLKNIPGLQLNVEKPGCKNTFWMVTVILDKKFGIDKLTLISKLLEYNIDSRPFFYPLSSLPPLKTKVNNPVSYRLSKYGINLPCGQNLTEKEINYICDALLTILKIKKV